MEDEAFGVVSTRRGLAIRVRSGQYANVIRRFRPEDADHFIGERWEVSGLPVTTGEEALKEFLHPWPVHAMYYFREGWRRTWVVRSGESPPLTVVEHQEGFAVINAFKPRATKQSEGRERRRPQSQGPALSGHAFLPLRGSAKTVTPAAAGAAPGQPARADVNIAPCETLAPAPTPTANIQDEIAKAMTAVLGPLVAQIE
jgi:hypothetical protein